MKKGRRLNHAFNQIERKNYTDCREINMRTRYNKLSSNHLLNILLSGLFALILIVPDVLAYTPIPGSPLANRVHPRLLITPTSIPSLRNEISLQFKSEFQNYVNWAVEGEGRTDATNVLSVSVHFPLRATLVHQAFVYALGEVPGITYPMPLQNYARVAIDTLIDRLNAGDELSYAAALTYDWTYNAMTDSERSLIAGMMVNRAINSKGPSQTMANPQVSPTQIELFSSKYSEGMYAWYLGLAFWGDGLIDAEADKAVDTFFDHMLNYGYLDGQNFVAGQEGGWSEWSGGYAMDHPLMHYLNINGWRTATDENYVANQGMGKISGNAIKHFAAFLHYTVDPHKYFGTTDNFIRMGAADAGDGAVSGLRWQLHFMPRMLAEAGLSNEVGLIQNFTNTYNVPWMKHRYSDIWGFLGATPGIQSKDPVTLGFPYSKWSKNLGLFYARSGFNSAADGVFHVNHGHFLFAGHAGADDDYGFALHKFGTLVNTRMVAKRSYGNLDAYPGAEKDNIVRFEGGHGKSYTTIERPDDLQKAATGLGNYDKGGVEQLSVKNGVFYHVRANRTREFIDGAEHTREYVWLPGANPAADSDFLVVYDRTKAPSKPHWIYHVPWLPSATNHSSTADLTTGSGLTDRIGTAYTGSNITIKELNGIGGEKDNNGGTKDFTGGAGTHGVAFSKTLLPKTARIEVTRVAQFDSDVIKRQGALAIISHRWQVDVIPTTSTTDHRFLHVFETADANLKSTMTPTALIEVGSQLQGTWITRESSNHPNYVVLFNKGNGPLTDTFSYTVTGNGQVKHVISGLKADTSYQVKDLVNGSTQNITTESQVSLWDYKGLASNTKTGTIYFESTISGTHTFTLIPQGAVQDTTPPSSPINLMISQLLTRWNAGDLN